MDYSCFGIQFYSILLSSIFSSELSGSSSSLVLRICVDLYISILNYSLLCFNFGSKILPPGWRGQGSLQSFCPKFKSTLPRVSHRLHSFYPASHLCLQNPCNFLTLDCFPRSWQVAIVNLWGLISEDICYEGTVMDGGLF